jgi:hypothetical protein
LPRTWAEFSLGLLAATMRLSSRQALILGLSGVSKRSARSLLLAEELAATTIDFEPCREWHVHRRPLAAARDAAEI